MMKKGDLIISYMRDINLIVKSRRTGKVYTVQNDYDNQDLIVNDLSEVFQDLENTNLMTEGGFLSNRHSTRIDEVRAYTLVGLRPAFRTFGVKIGRLKDKNW